MLYPYQKEGVGFLLEREGGMLFDDPGLGKTRQAVVAAKRKGRYPILVVCPSPLRPWWAEEIRQVCPGDNVLVAGQGGRFGPDNDEHIDDIANGYFGAPKPDVHWVIVHYTGVSMEDKQFANVTWGTVIADECFPYEVEVLTDCGPLPIGRIVEENLPVRVIACDLSNNVVEHKHIKRRIVKPLVGTLVRVRHTFGSFVCTPNHKLWTEENGYVEATKASEKTVRVVREDVSYSEQRQSDGEVLRHASSSATRSQEGTSFVPSRVERVEVLKRGSLDRSGFSGFVYNLEVADHHNYIADGVLVSNCHYIKNRKADRSQAVKFVTPIDAFRVGLTATPTSTCVADLWSQLAWVSEDFRDEYPTYWRFFEEFVQYKIYTTPQGHKVKRPLGVKNKDKLAEVMGRYALSRRKATVAKDLPKLQETVMPLPLEGRQAVVYQHLRKDAEIAIRDSVSNEVTGMVIRNGLSRMMAMERWLSCPWTKDSGVRGVKMVWLKEWTDGYEEPAVVMTHFKDSAEGVAKKLGVRAITGDTPQDERQEILEEWRRGDTQFLVGTIGTIGTGLNLVEAYTIVFYDQVYSPILMRQAKDRIHRITTDHPVQAIYLVVEKTSNKIVYESFTESLSQLEMIKRFVEHLKEAT